MKLSRVTVTGADDSVAPGQLLELSRRFPFVEWGILVSKNSMGSPRFPSSSWLQMMAADFARKDAQLSLHLCGTWLRNLLLGVVPPLTPIAPVFQRMQLNFHGERQNIGTGFEEALAAMGIPEIIFQIDGNMGQEIIAHVEGNGRQTFKCVPLFDLSHGAGVLPADWPKPFDFDTFHGYAGGLGPDNLEEQIQKIGEAAGDAPFWIDMETKVRSGVGGGYFDLEKVERCLEIAARFVQVDVIKDCARMRAARATQPMTIADAIDKVRWLERTPDGILDPLVAKRVMATLLGAIEASPCYYKAVTQNLPSFTLIPERAAVIALREWANAAKAHGARPEKYEPAFQMAVQWDMRPGIRWPT